VLARLRSPDAQVRVRALHGICPCAAGFPLYERFRGEVKRLKKDPDPGVRAAALHVEHDACEIETIAAGLDKADEQGWRYSDTDWVSKHRQRQATGYPSDQPHLARLPETLATQKLRNSRRSAVGAGRAPAKSRPRAGGAAGDHAAP